MIPIRNDTDYPDREVRKLVERTLGYADITSGVTVEVGHHTRKRKWSAVEADERRGHHGSYRLATKRIKVVLPRPGIEPSPYFPYSRVRGDVPTFPLRDWREALVATVGHEAQHHRFHLKHERHVEADCDRAAWRAVQYHREDEGVA